MLQTSPHAYHLKRISSFGEGWNAVPSNNFTSREGGQVILEGAGQGHGIGLCPEAGGSFRQILDHYFPNTALILFGEQNASRR